MLRCAVRCGGGDACARQAQCRPAKTHIRAPATRGRASQRQQEELPTSESNVSALIGPRSCPSVPNGGGVRCVARRRQTKALRRTGGRAGVRGGCTPVGPCQSWGGKNQIRSDWIRSNRDSVGDEKRVKKVSSQQVAVHTAGAEARFASWRRRAALCQQRSSHLDPRQEASGRGRDMQVRTMAWGWPPPSESHCAAQVGVLNLLQGTTCLAAAGPRLTHTRERIHTAIQYTLLPPPGHLW